MRLPSSHFRGEEKEKIRENPLNFVEFSSNPSTRNRKFCVEGSRRKAKRKKHPTRGTKLTVEFQRNTNTHEHDNGNKDEHAQRRRANDK